VELRVQLLRPQHVDAAGPECAANEGPVRLDETQDPMEGDIGVDSRLDDLDLLQLSVYQLGAVAGSDEELLCPCADDAAFDLELRTPLVLLRVDEPDACRCDGEVVDVRS